MKLLTLIRKLEISLLHRLPCSQTKSQRQEVVRDSLQKKREKTGLQSLSHKPLSLEGVGNLADHQKPQLPTIVVSKIDLMTLILLPKK